MDVFSVLEGVWDGRLAATKGDVAQELAKWREGCDKSPQTQRMNNSHEEFLTWHEMAYERSGMTHDQLARLARLRSRILGMHATTAHLANLVFEAEVGGVEGIARARDKYRAMRARDAWMPEEFDEAMRSIFESMELRLIVQEGGGKRSKKGRL